jgi:hypothetical protein
VSGDQPREGSLATRDFPDLLHLLHTEGWTGILTLTTAGIVKGIHVQEGRLVFATSSSPDERLGQLLLRRGRISFRDFVEAGQEIAPGRRLGAILVDRGVVTPKDLLKWVVEHTQEIIYGAFQWTEGRYGLQDGIPSSETITLKMSTPNIILEGLRRVEAWSRIERGVGGLDALYVRDSAYQAVCSSMSLTPEQYLLLNGLDGPKSVDTLCRESGLSDWEVCVCLWAFRVSGLIHRVDATESLVASVEDEGLGAVLMGD